MDKDKSFLVNIDGLDVIVSGRRKIRVCIGIPVSDSISPKFLIEMLLRMEEWYQTFDILLAIETSIPLDEARNKIVKEAIKNKCDYIFFIDSDTLIQRGQLEQLISWEKNAITGISYMKMPPYFSLLRKRVGYRLYVPIEYSLPKHVLQSDSELIKVDGAGLGCFLVKTAIFNEIKFPWFHFEFFNYDDEWRHIGEDLYFCEKLNNANIDIYCDLSVQCAHIGTNVIIDMVNKYRDVRSSILDDAEKCKTELSEFTGLSLYDVTNKCHISTKLVAKQYKCDVIENGKDPKKFYRENRDYIFDLISWHMYDRRAFDVQLIDDIKDAYPNAKTVLDFGSGCGQNAIMLAEAGYDVSITDYEGYTSEFARFRIKKRGLNIKFYDIEKPIDDMFDIILAFDVLEHIPDEEFENTILLLKSLKKNGGKILSTVSFGTQGGLHPMHFESSPKKVKLIEKLNED